MEARISPPSLICLIQAFTLLNDDKTLELSLKYTGHNTSAWITIGDGVFFNNDTIYRQLLLNDFRLFKNFDDELSNISLLHYRIIG